jgi:hypothetical protein
LTAGFFVFENSEPSAFFFPERARKEGSKESGE